MAQIITYPKLSTLANNDLLIVSDVSSKNKNTNSVELQTLANFIITSTSGITGSGTLNTIAMFTPDGQSIGDSVITQAPLGQAITVNTGLDVVEDLNVTGSIETSSNLLVNGTTTLYGPLEVNSTYYDAAGDEGTDGDVLVAKGTPGNMVTRWVSKAGTGIATGSGTTNTLPIWTDGPNGVLGDSIITYDNTFIPIITIGPQPSRLEVDGDFTVRNRASFAGPYARFSCPIEDTSNSPGTTGQVLTSTVTGVAWDDATDIVSGAVAKLIPFNVTASPGGSSVYNADNNIVEISWTTGNGIYVLILPTATGSNAYRNIRFVTNGTFPGGASHKIEITALPGETVDGAAFFEISKTYEGVSLWSNGTEWIVIQAKAH